MNLMRGNPYNKRWSTVLIVAVCLTIFGGGIVNLSMQRLAEPSVTTSDIEQSLGDIVAKQSAKPQEQMLVSMVDGKRVLIIGRLEVTPHGLFVVHDAPLGSSHGAGNDVSQTPMSLFLAERGFVAVQMMRQNALNSEAMQQAQDARDFARAYVEQAVPCNTYVDTSEPYLRLRPEGGLV
jgi:hypothetical protein